MTAILISLCWHEAKSQLNCSGGLLNCVTTAANTIYKGSGTGLTASSMTDDGTTLATTEIFRNTSANGLSIGGDGGLNRIQWTSGQLQVLNSANSAAATLGLSFITSGGSATTIASGSVQMRGNAVLLDGTPTCSGGGCVVLANSINSAGSVSTTTTGAADITISFSANFQHAPVCLGDNATTGNLLRATQEAVGSFHLQGVTASGDTLGYVCVGN